MELHAPETFNRAKLLGVFTNGSPEWHSARAEGIGGSEVGTILGLNPYESPYALWCKKTGRIPSEIEENWAIRFGKAFEGPILGLWQEEHPEYEVFETGTYQHPDLPYLHANPDALGRHKETGEWIVIEVKTARSTWDSVPMGYQAQVLHYMDVLDIKRGVIVAVAGMTWYEHEVEYNADMIQVQRDFMARFWDYLQADIKPDWDGSDATYQAVRAQHPDIDDSEVDVGELGEQLLNAHAQHAVVTAELNKLKSQLLDTMGKAKRAYYETQNGRVEVASRQRRAGNAALIIKKGS